MNFSGFIDTDSLRVCFIKGDISDVFNKFENIIKETLNKKWQVNNVELSNSSFNEIIAFNSHFKLVKCLLWNPQQTASNTVAFITNIPDGWPTLLNHYFNRYKNDIIQVVLSDSTKKFPLYKFEKLQSSGNRIVQVLKEEDKWLFFQRGHLLSYENDMYYRKRKISDRLNSDIIKTYLLNEGIDIDNIEFWRSKRHGVLFTTLIHN